jgi:dTDP-4-dehydrorhamnose reductase
MAVVLVTGANGQLGNELKKISRKYWGYDFLFTDIDELNITDDKKVSQFIDENRPDWIINCAAYNMVDKAETEKEEANLINHLAVRNIASVIKGTDCRLIHISTDYVFSGGSNVPYCENDYTEPLTEYGKSKLAGEKAALLHNYSMVIRTSWLYSSFGSNFVKTIISKAAEKDSLNVVFDQTGSPTWAADLADAIMVLLSSVIRNQIAFNAGIYHYSNEGICSWFDFAVAIIEEAGLKCNVIPVRSETLNYAAKRPSYSVLDKTRIRESYNIEIPYWRTSLKKCLKEII